MNHRTGGARQHVQALRPGEVGAMCSCRAAVGPRQGEGPVTDLAAGGESLVTATVRDAAGPIHAIEFGSQSLRQRHGGDTAVEVRTIRSA